MSKKTLVTFAFSILIVALFAFSYSYFSKYSPKILKKVNEVKGLSSIHTDDVPYPKDAVKIGTNQTPTSKQTTFRTGQDIQEVADFYKKTYSEKRWKSVNEKIEDGTATLSFRKEAETINIVITTEDENTTIVSIEKIQNNY
jgi:hypothetical protein